MTDDKRKPGRPALPPGEKLVVVPVRLTEAQKAKLQRIGVQRLRDLVDQGIGRGHFTAEDRDGIFGHSWRAMIDAALE